MQESDTTILLVEDDAILAEGLGYALEGEGYHVATAATVAEGERLIRSREIDLLLLDVGLPDGDGFELCRRVKAGAGTPVIFLSAREEEIHIVRGLEIGGDDYIAKPFRLRELLARIGAVLRRRRGDGDPPVILRDGELHVDTGSRRVWSAGTEVSLTPTEFALLETLLQNRGRVVPRDRLLATLWDDQRRYVEENTLSVYIRRVREKVECDPASPKRIETVRGIGYRWL